MCNQNECSFIINISPAANVLRKPYSETVFNNVLLSQSLEISTTVEGTTNFRLLLRKMKHQAYFNFMFSSWLSILSKQPAYLLTDGWELCNCPSFCFPGFHVEKTLTFITHHNRISLTFITYHNRLSHMQAPQRWSLGPTMVVSVASSSVGTLSSHRGNPREPHPVPTPHILLPPASCTFDFPIEGNDSNQVPQVTAKAIWLCSCYQAKCVHPGSPREATVTGT